MIKNILPKLKHYIPFPIFGAEPRRLCGIMEEDPEMKVDRLTSGILEFASGTLTFTCATQLQNSASKKGLYP